MFPELITELFDSIGHPSAEFAEQENREKTVEHFGNTNDAVHKIRMIMQRLCKNFANEETNKQSY